jgi:branched-chain amino acid transport system substrate-binding protein
MRGSRRHVMLGLLVAALLSTMLMAGCGSDTSSDTTTPTTENTEPIKIGAIVSLTGTYAGLGDPEKKTIEMEVKKINDAGGINGRPVEVLFEDDGTDEAKAVAAASKLIEQDGVVAIIGCTGTGATMAIRSEIDRAGMPQLSMAGSTVITDPVNQWVFATPWPNKIIVPFELKYLKDEGITKIGLISDTGGFGKDGRAVILAQAPTYGITVTSDQTFNVGDTDMTAQLTNIKQSGAQAVVMWSAGKEASTVAKNVKQLGLTIPLFGSHGNARTEFIEGSGDAAEGFRFAAGKILIPEAWGVDTEEYEVATTFIDEYEAAYGAPPNTFAGHAYDALYLITEAAKRIDGEITPAALRDEIQKTDGFVGIDGKFKFSPTDHNGLTENDIVMYEVKNGAWTLAQ